MKRKFARKHTSAKRLKPNLYIRYVSIIFAVLAVIIVGSFVLKATSNVHVLGSSTGPVLLADDNNQSDSPQGGEKQGDSNPSSNNDSHPSSPQNNSNPSDNTQQSDNSEASHESNISSGNNSVQQSSDSTQVDCIEPDGKHFTTSFHDCKELNQKMGHGTFNFTPLGTPQGDNNSEPQQPEPSQKPEPTEVITHETQQTPQGTLEVQTEGNKGELNLESAGTHIEIKKEDDGSIKITAHKADGTEVQLQTNALDQINKNLEGENVSVSTTSANGFAIKSQGVQAETNFPLSIDPSAKTLSVTTPNGTTDVTTLPNQAVQNVLQQKIISNVLSTANQTTASAAAANNIIALTELNNQPAYEVQGVSDKKLFGIFPVAYQKTVYVSTQNGQTLQTQEALFNKILEAFSF